MPVSLKTFNEAFTAASLKDKGLSSSHKQQLDVLREIADAINAEGNFAAELTKWIGDAAGLKITKTGESAGQYASFAIGYGSDASGEATIHLTSGARHAPLGKSQGYNLQDPTERNDFLKELGRSLSERFAGAKLASETLVYVTERKNTPHP